MAAFTPVDCRTLTVEQSLFKHLDNELLLVLGIERITGSEFSCFGKRKPQCIQLLSHIVDVAVSPLFRVSAVLDGRIFRRHPERIPSDGMQYIELLLSVVARQRITNGIVAHMPHMQTAAGEREHTQNILFRLCVGIARLECLLFLPLFLPFCFDFTWGITHCRSLEKGLLGWRL